jgi:hypothetical protein
VKRHQARHTSYRRQQRRDVGKSDHRLGRSGERFVVDPVENPGDAVPASEAPDRVDVGSAEGGIEIRQPLVVGAGEITVAPAGVSPQHRDVAQRTAYRLGAGYIIPFQEWACRRHQRNSTAGAQLRGTSQWF